MASPLGPCCIEDSERVQGSARPEGRCRLRPTLCTAWSGLLLRCAVVMAEERGLEPKAVARWAGAALPVGGLSGRPALQAAHFEALEAGSGAGQLSDI